MGAVYKALDTSTDEHVALKRLKAEDGELVPHDELRFRREYHTLASLRHPRIVAAYDYGRDRTGAFYTMELLDGQDLKKMSPMRPAQACSVLRDIAAALAFLHTQGLIHRDLKPRNIRYTSEGTVKLIDFGVMATVGATAEVAGTPNYTAPETVYGRFLDGRTDLYALGAVGYQLLTGRSPFPARTFKALRDAWRDPPAPPSTFAAAVDGALDELILELLCLNPLGRPPSAAVVMDRLTGIGGLARDPDLELERGYLASATMVGRRREMAFLRRGIDRAAHGDVALSYVAAPSGTGKSRLMRELALDAKLSGGAVALVSGETAAVGPYGAAETLLIELFKTNPAMIEDAPADAVGTLARVFPRFAERLGSPKLTPPNNDPGEERMRVQRAIAKWLIAAARRQMIVMLVDDLQRLDEASASALAAVVRDEHAKGIYLAVAQRTGEPVRAPAPVGFLSRAGEAITLEGLDEKDLGELVRSFFGDVQHTGRLAKFMHDFTGGSPLLCNELAEYLVDAGIVRYADGTWIIPMEISREALPASLGAAMDRRLDHLDPSSRALGEVLAVVGGRISLSTAVALAEERDQTAVFAGLGRLAAQSVLLEADGAFRFRHDQLREALLRGLDDERRRALHLRVARQLTAEDVGDEREAEVGWHFLHGGERERGAQRLERAGTRLFQAQALSDCLGPLEAAHDVLRERGASATRRLDILFMLLAAGWVSNRDVGYRFAEEAVLAHKRHSGIEAAHRLGPLLGRPLALVVGILYATLSWLFTFRGPRGPNPSKALVSFSVAVGYACGLIYSANRRDEVLAMIEHVEPMNCFENRLTYAAYLGMQAFPAILDGRLGTAEQVISTSLDIVENDNLTPATDEEKHFIEAGLRGLRVILDVNQFNPRIDADLKRIEELEFRYYHLVAQTARVVRHRYRGEEQRALQVEREMEAASLQLGSWSTDLQMLLFAHPAYALCHDVGGLKRCLEELESFVDEGFRFEARVAMTRAEIARESGDPHEAVRLLEAHRPQLADYDYLMRQWLDCALAEAYLAAERYEEAYEGALASIALGEDEDYGIVLSRLRAERVAVLALANLARFDAAHERLVRALALAEDLDCPVMAGHLHEAWARIAFQEGDTLAFEVHTEAAGKWLRPTGNPFLVAVHERLLRLGRGSGSTSVDPPSRSSTRPSADEETVHVPSLRSGDTDTETRRH